MPMYVDRKENLIYLDNRGVRITKTWLRVGNSTYAIGNITSFSTGEGRPGYIGPVLGTVTGLAIALFGFDTGSWIAVGAGVLFIAVAIGWGVSLKPHYFLRIVSTGAESRPVRSKDRAYIESIIAGIHKAKLQQE